MIRRIKKVFYRKSKIIWRLSAIVCLFLLGLFFYRQLPWFRFNLEAEPANQVVTNFQIIPTNLKSQESFISFSDLFSSSAWLDRDKTSLFHNLSSMTLSFTPDINLELIGDCPKNIVCQTIDQSMKNQTTCINDRCLNIVNNNLVYQERRVVWPAEIDAVVKITIATFNDRWLVGVIINPQPEQYQIFLYWFDGINFEPILLNESEEPAQSRYLGQLSFGGQADNLLVLYSAYDGRAWQIQGSKIRDLKHYFGIRVNNGGFWPGIISQQYDGQTVWYVFDRGGNQSRLLKFWQNDSDWIEGSIDLSDQLPQGSRSAQFLAGETADKLDVKIIDSDGQASLWSMTDRGFVQSSDFAQVVSVSLMTYSQHNPVNIVGASIADIIGGWSGFEVIWFLSTDGINWQIVQPGQRLNFDQPVGQLWWRWQIKPSSNRQYSPCLKKINLYYYRQTQF